MLLLLAILFCLVPAATAARNFSGVWRMNPDSLLANIDTVLRGAALITINMNANQLTLIADSPRMFEEYILDGDDHRISTRFGNMTYSTMWEGDTLVITRTPAKNSGFKTQILRFSITPNMRYLQITCTKEGENSPSDDLKWEKR